ncbi:hypothetical protein GQ457_04G014820 [Hibiscus cannabinus]
MYSNRDPSLLRKGAKNIFIKNLNKRIEQKVLHDTFSLFGNILSGKLASDPLDQLQGYGFVHFNNEERAQKEIEQLNGMPLNDKQAQVDQFICKQERDTSSSKTNFDNALTRNFLESTNGEDLNKIFVYLVQSLVLQ